MISSHFTVRAWSLTSVMTAMFIIPHSAISEDCVGDFPSDVAMVQTLDTVYLNSATDHAVSFDGNEIHDWTRNPVDNRWYTALWIGEGNSGELSVGTGCQILTGQFARTRPEYTLQLTAYPETLDSIVSVVNSLGGNIQINLADGHYRTGDIVVTANNVNLVALNPGRAIFNGASVRDLTFSPHEIFGKVFVSDQVVGVDRDLHQIHAKVSGRLERLPAIRGSSPRQWNTENLNISAHGGWFIDLNNRLSVRLPNDLDPTSKLHLSGDNTFAFDFTGNQIWVEGLTFEHYGVHPAHAITEHFRQSGFSGMRFSGNTIDVRNNIFRFNRTYALNFAGATDVLTQENHFLDSQQFMTYMQTRIDGQPGIGHKTSNAVLYIKSSNVTHRLNTHEYNLQGVIAAGTRFIDILDNQLLWTRNKPIEIRDSKVASGSNAGDVDRIGHSITVARNVYDHVGWSLPSNEGNAETGPVWWINNCVMQFGWPGTNWVGDTIHSQANRYGGLDNRVRLGIQLVYNNLLMTDQIDPGFKEQFGWNPSGKAFHRGSKFFNNIWLVADPRPDQDFTTMPNAYVWSANSSIAHKIINRTEWDHNQYYMRSGNEHAFIPQFHPTDGLTLNQMRTRFTSFEPNGAFQDPVISGCVANNPIPLRDIQGVTSNPVLFP